MRSHYLITAALVLVTLVAFEPLRHNDFIRFDDPSYITAQPQVLAGLTGASVKWAFNVGSNGNWHPLTWLSHMLDVQLWGVNARGHHLMNLAFHVASVVILFQLMRRMTSNDGCSAFVAAVFAVHPLHVESVAWAAERKDVLSTLLGLAALWFWVGWTKARGSWRYWTSVAFFALSLTAKPMFVTLPLLLLLLDFWPLSRFKTASARPKERPTGHSIGELLREKIPYFVLTVASCVMTVEAQTVGNAVTGASQLPLSMRFDTAVFACVQYLFKAIWPTKLSIFYPYPIEGAPTLVVSIGSIFLVAATIAALGYARRMPWLATGWLWWLGMLVPVSGVFVQIGRQGMADRYMYAPLIGLSILVAWSAAAYLGRRRNGTIVSVVLGVGAVCAMTVLTRAQVRTWKDDQTVFEHAAAVTERNHLAQRRLGTTMMDQKKYAEAAAHYALAVQYDPEVADAHNDYGVALMNLERYDEAIQQFTEAIRRKPIGADTYFNRARGLTATKRFKESIADIHEGLRQNPDSADGRRLLDEVLGFQARHAPPK